MENKIFKMFTDEKLAFFGDKIKTYVQNAISSKAELEHTHTTSDINGLESTLEEKVSIETTVNGKSLTGDIVLSASDVGADSEGSALSALESAKQYTNEIAETKSNVGHAHDDMYYTESEIDTKVSVINASITGIKDGTITVGEAKHSLNSDQAINANNAEKATQDDSGNIIKDTYETKVDSASKLTEAKSYADGIKNDLLNGAGAAYDTLKELGELIDDNTDAIDALEIVASGKAEKVHTHEIADINNLQDELDVLDDSILLKKATISMPVTGIWNFILYGNGKYVSAPGNQNMVVYSDDCAHWTQIPISITKQWGCGAYGNNKFVIISTNTNIVIYSTDGITWNETSMPVSSYWQSVTYGNGKFVAVGTDGAAVYSEDGITWTEITMPTSSSLSTVVYGGSMFVSVPYDSNIAVYSTNGIDWTQTTLPVSGDWYSVAYGNGKFVSVISDSNIAAYSTDGINWTQITIPEDNWFELTYGNGRFVAVAQNSNTAAYSTNGITWTQVPVPYYGNGPMLTYINNRFMVCLDSAEHALFCSYDGINWYNYVEYFTNIENDNVTNSVYDSLGIDVKQDKLTFDSAPIQGSTNPITSDGIKNALDSKQNIITGVQGQMVGFDESGNAVASDMSMMLPDYTSSDNGKYLTIINGSPVWFGNIETIWGDETAEGDTTWWEELSDWASTASEAELSSCLGKTKSVTLSTEILGTTTHLVQCIGYNCDGKNTLTFQTKNTLANTTKFGSNGYWVGSTARSLCNDYYNAFPGKVVIKTVSKGTCATATSKKNGIPTYNDETVFLLSDCEMGFTSDQNVYSSSYDEFCEENISKTPYQYYTDNASRIKCLGDNNTSAQTYWERSLYAYNYTATCAIRAQGDSWYYTATKTYGFAPAFVIGGIIEEEKIEIPSYSTSDDGKFLRVVNGVLAWDALTDASTLSV